MYNFQIVSGGIKEREIRQGLKLRPSYDQAIEEDVEKPMIEQYTATGVFKSQKFQNILNNDIENLDSLQRNKIRSDLLKRDLIDGGVDIHQAQEQASRQIRQPIITQLQDPFENIEDTLEDIYDALDTHQRKQEESSSSSSAMINREMIDQLSKDYVNDLVNKMQTQILSKDYVNDLVNRVLSKEKFIEQPEQEAPKEEEVEVDEPKEEKVEVDEPKAKAKAKAKGMMAPPMSASEIPFKKEAEKEKKEDEPKPKAQAKTRSKNNPQVNELPSDIEGLLDKNNASSYLRKDVSELKKVDIKTINHNDIPLIDTSKTQRELERDHTALDLFIQVTHPIRKIKIDKKKLGGDKIEFKASGINKLNQPFEITFEKDSKTKDLNKIDYVKILKAYEG